MGNTNGGGSGSWRSESVTSAHHVSRPKEGAISGKSKVSLLGVDALWGDCKFIPADWGVIVADLYYVALFEDFSL